MSTRRDGRPRGEERHLLESVRGTEGMVKSDALESIVSPDNETQIAPAVLAAGVGVALVFLVGVIYRLAVLVL